MIGFYNFVELAEKDYYLEYLVSELTTRYPWKIIITVLVYVPKIKLEIKTRHCVSHLGWEMGGEKFPRRKSENVEKEVGKGEKLVNSTFNQLISNMDKYRTQSHWGPSKSPWLACFRIFPPEAGEMSKFIHWFPYHWLRGAPHGSIFFLPPSLTYIWVASSALEKALSSK